MASTTRTTDDLIRELRTFAEPNWAAQTTAMTADPVKWVGMLAGADHVLWRCTQLVNRGGMLLGSQICTAFVWILPTRAEATFRNLAEALGVSLEDGVDGNGNRQVYWGPGSRTMIGNNVG